MTTQTELQKYAPHIKHRGSREAETEPYWEDRGRGGYLSAVTCSGDWEGGEGRGGGVVLPPSPGQADFPLNSATACNECPLVYGRRINNAGLGTSADKSLGRVSRSAQSRFTEHVSRSRSADLGPSITPHDDSQTVFWAIVLDGIGQLSIFRYFQLTFRTIGRKSNKTCQNSITQNGDIGPFNRRTWRETVRW